MNLNPTMATFLRLTAVIAVVLIGLWLLIHILPLILMAAVVAALIVGGFFLYRAISRRSGTPFIR
jgi:hypothetical protein